MDYEAEKTMELEALEAILADDLQLYEGTLPHGWNSTVKTYKVRINPEDDGEATSASNSHEQKLMELLFQHTPHYPDEAPYYKLRSVQGLSDAALAKGMEVLKETVEANVGMAMMYTLVAAAKEWLQDNSSCEPAAVDPALARKKEQEEDERKRAELRSHGIMVTLETFAAWKKAFDAELAAERQRLLEAGKIDEKSQRMTGKAYFLAQASMQEEEEDEMGSSDDDENIQYTSSAAPGQGASSDGEDEEEDLDYDDDDDEGLLEEFVPTTATIAAASLGHGKK